MAADSRDAVTRLRLAARRAVGRLPEGGQLRLREALTAYRGGDWASEVARLRRREKGLIAGLVREHAKRAGRRRVLVCLLQQLPPIAEVSYSLAAALQLRGHDVAGLLCDGLLPVCEMNLARLDRPPCGVCAAWAGRYEQAFGFSFDRLSRLVGPADRARAEQLISGTPDDELAELEVAGVPVGRLARRELQRYHRGFVFHAERDPMYRPWLVAGVLLVELAGRWLDGARPDVLVVSSGRTLLASCLSGAARARGIRVVSWDLENSHPDGLVFSHDAPAVELPLDDAWRSVAGEPLSSEEREALHAFLGRWARSDGTPFPYNRAPIHDPGAIRSRLGLRPGAPLVAAFTNAAWDMAVCDRDAGFSSMFEWIFALVDYAIAHPGIDLVVRAHPAEVNVPADLRSTTPVTAEIRARYPSLPSNIRLLDGDTPVSSYALAAMAQVPVMYATRLGLEMAIRGRRAWLAGETTYRGRGFTRDVASGDDMVACLEAGLMDERLSAAEIARAERFAYLWFFRYVVRVPRLRPADRRFRLASFADLGPAGDPVIDRICEAIVTGAPFLDLGRPRPAATLSA